MDAQAIRIVGTHVQYRNVLATKAKVENCRATNFRKRASDSARRHVVGSFGVASNLGNHSVTRWRTPYS